MFHRAATLRFICPILNSLICFFASLLFDFATLLVWMKVNLLLLFTFMPALNCNILHPFFIVVFILGSGNNERKHYVYVLFVQVKEVKPYVTVSQEQHQMC